MNPYEGGNEDREEMFNRDDSKSPNRKHRMSECFDNIFAAKEPKDDMCGSEHRHRGRTYGGLPNKLLDSGKTDQLQETGNS